MSVCVCVFMLHMRLFTQPFWTTCSVLRYVGQRLPPHGNVKGLQCRSRWSLHDGLRGNNFTDNFLWFLTLDSPIVQFYINKRTVDYIHKVLSEICITECVFFVRFPSPEHLSNSEHYSAIIRLVLLGKWIEILFEHQSTNASGEIDTKQKRKSMLHQM